MDPPIPGPGLRRTLAAVIVHFLYTSMVTRSSYTKTLRSDKNRHATGFPRFRFPASPAGGHSGGSKLCSFTTLRDG
jgi:hypothetical protein